MTNRRTLLFILLVFYSLNSKAQITPEQYFSIRQIYANKIDTCTILKWSKDNQLTPDLSIIFDRANLKMTMKDQRNDGLIEFIYNKDTQLIIQNLYSSSNSKEKRLISRDSFFYNSKKQKVRYKSVNFINQKELPVEATYLYKNDTLITVVYTYGKEIFRTIVYAYDAKANVNHQTVLSAKATENYYYVYNNKHQLESYYSIGKSSTDTLFEHRYLYDAQGNQIEDQVYDFTGKLEHTYKKSYLENGLLNNEESFLLIKNEDLSTALYQKKVYRYGFRKSK